VNPRVSRHCAPKTRSDILVRTCGGICALTLERGSDVHDRTSPASIYCAACLRRSEKRAFLQAQGNLTASPTQNFPTENDHDGRQIHPLIAIVGTGFSRSLAGTISPAASTWVASAPPLTRNDLRKYIDEHGPS